MADSTDVDPGDFDALGVVSGVIGTIATRARATGGDVVARFSAPPGRHRVNVTARAGGHLILSVRYTDLTTSRRNNTAQALEGGGWDLDDDSDGVTRRYPPGSDAATVAFDLLSTLTVAGSPATVRTISAVDASGAVVPLP